MTRHIKKADKLVTKATTVFGDAVIQVFKANDLLAAGIDKDSQQIHTDENKILELQRLISITRKSREEKSIKISNNTVLVEQLQNFVPQK